jgi:hypothetical protein
MVGWEGLQFNQQRVAEFMVSDMDGEVGRLQSCDGIYGRTVMAKRAERHVVGFDTMAGHSTPVTSTMNSATTLMTSHYGRAFNPSNINRALCN